MIKGIQIKNGTLFVEWGGFSTYRYTERDGWEVSRYLYSVVEWDMKNEGPDAFEFLTEGDIRALDSFDTLRALHRETCAILGFAFEDEPAPVSEEEAAPVSMEDVLSYLEDEK
ncbi:MAG: hypothetical protein E7609_07235 [Ruminococcaceae bacterium]|nr:hypothetical protein [Oscillospiraceae bacterium]